MPLLRQRRDKNFPCFFWFKSRRGAADADAVTHFCSRLPPSPRLMAKTRKRDPVLSLSASADATTPGQTAKLVPPRPKGVNLEDLDEFQDEQVSLGRSVFPPIPTLFADFPE
jgi:hypothetical protein